MSHGKPPLISWRVALVGTVIEFLAFDLGSRLEEAQAPWDNLRHYPVLLTVVGLGVWLARRDPRRWVRAILIHVPAVFVIVTMLYEVLVRAETGHPELLDGTTGAWEGVAVGALAMGLCALVAAWLEPGARSRRAALKAETQVEFPPPAS